jgi:hypothetical protein
MVVMVGTGHDCDGLVSGAGNDGVGGIGKKGGRGRYQKLFGASFRLNMNDLTTWKPMALT